MAALDSIPNGSDVLIDTNVFIYAVSNSSAQCASFLARCSREQIYGITLFEVIHEATHRFMVAEARQKGFFNREDKGAKYLSKHPEEVKRLTDYWTNTKRLLALNLVLLPSEERIVVGAQRVRAEAGLMTNDSVIIAAMREYGISQIATHDHMFSTVNGISVFEPTDL